MGSRERRAREDMQLACVSEILENPNQACTNVVYLVYIYIFVCNQGYSVYIESFDLIRYLLSLYFILYALLYIYICMSCSFLNAPNACRYLYINIALTCLLNRRLSKTRGYNRIDGGRLFFLNLKLVTDQSVSKMEGKKEYSTLWG